MGKFCGICRSNEHHTGDHYKKIQGSDDGATSTVKGEAIRPHEVKKGSSPAPDSLINPPVRGRGRKRVYKDNAARQRAYRARKE
jgi:hypothetical protein